MKKLMFALVLSVVATVVSAKTLYVSPWGSGEGTSWLDSISLSNAVMLAAASDEATEIKVREGDYPLVSQLSLTNVTVTLRGGYTGVGETRGTTPSTIYRDNSIASLRLLEGVGATLTLDSLAFTNATSTVGINGVAMRLENCTTVVTNCMISKNNVQGKSMHGFSGCVYIKGGSFNAYDSAISENIYRGSNSFYGYGGGLYITGLPTVGLYGCSVSSNRFAYAYGTWGAGLYASEAASLVISNCTFVGNYGRRAQNSTTQRIAYGGAIYYAMSTKMTSVFQVSDTLFEGNWLNVGNLAPGGCIYISEGGHNQGKHPVYFTRCVFKDNGKRDPNDPDASTAAATDAGDFYFSGWYWTLYLENCVFTGTAKRNAMRHDGGYMQAKRCTFANTAEGYGLEVNSSLTMRDSIVWGNASGGMSIKQGVSPTITYSDLQDGNAGVGNFCEDPKLSTDGWAHLLSKAGYYANGGFTGGTLTYASVDSPCIDAGDPALSVDAEPQPNRHLPNIGGYAGTPAASRTTLGSDPVVHLDQLQVFAWDVVPEGEGARIRGEVASTGGGTDPQLYVVYGDEDVPGATSLDDWDYHTLIGTYAPWDPASALVPGAEGTTYCRLAVTSEKGLAFSDPVLSFVTAKPATLSVAKVFRVQRTTAQVQMSISADGGADTTLQVRYWKTSEGETKAKTVSLNYGLVVAVGTLYEYALTGLTAGTEYEFRLEAVNGAGTVSETAVKTTNANTARTFYVTTTGAGDQDGAVPASAFGNIQSALDVATVNGDVISISAGTHVGSQPNPSELSTLYIASRTGVTLRGDLNGGTVLTIGSSDVRIFHGKSSTLTFEDLTFRGGRCWANNNYGGAVYCESSTFTFNRCIFEDNGIPDLGQSGSYQYGGAVGAMSGTMTFNGCTFRRNSVCSNAGVCCSYGGAVYGTTMTFADCTFQTNKVCGYTNGSVGGAIYCGGGTLTITNCTFVGNHAQKTRNGTAGWDGGYDPYGGALYVVGGANARIVESDFDGNYVYVDSAVNHGGLAYIAGATTKVAFDRCRVLNGGVSGLSTYTNWDSGAISLVEGRLTLVNTLFAGGHSNAVEVAGGTLVATNVTIAGNDHHGLLQTGGTATFVNSILWNNAGGIVTNGTAALAFDHSDVQTNGVGVLAAGNGNIQRNPKFAEGYSLRGSSPCIGTGVNADWMDGATDVDGNPRIRYGTVDMGACECEKPGLMLLVR